MSVLVPWFLAAGALGVAAILALHLLARDEPPRWLLPTARFVPVSRERAPARSFSPSDRLLLALRVLALAAISLAAAGPSWHGSRRARAQVIVADLARMTADRGDVARLVRAAWREGDRIVALDSVARTVSLAGLDSLAVRPAAARAGRLSAALLVALDEGRSLARGADSVALLIVSPLVADAMDAATMAIRATWPGGARLLPVAERVGVAPEIAARAVELRAAADDPVRVTLALDGRAVTNATNAAPRATNTPPPLASHNTDDAATVRLVRTGPLTAQDSAHARAGGVLVHWPDALRIRDTVGAVTTAHATFVATLPRPAPLDGGLPIALWVDGTPAAVEGALGAGCTRRVAIPIASAGDASLRAPLRSILRDLLAPCGGRRDATPLDAAQRRALAGGRAAAASASLLAPSADAALARWLLALAALALALEWWFRRRQERA